MLSEPRVMATLGMLESAPLPGGATLLARRSEWGRAPRSGLFHAHVALGATCQRGDELGFVTTPYGAEKTPVRARQDGVVIGLATNPHVFQGDAIVHIAAR